MANEMVTRRSFLWLAGAAVASKYTLAIQTSASPVVKTVAGSLEGEEVDGVRVFRGVPFAEPPVRELRFRPAVSVKPWKDLHQANAFRIAATQSSGFESGEDCLYLNVWAPMERGSHPVFVWIHGGGFLTGRASEAMFDGRGFAKEGIVVVTISYRLGALGFMDVSPLLGAEYEGSANNGVRDVVMALKWVQENIAAFGGDPSRVTVGGQSAGAKMTDLLLACEQAKPLFAQAISESGGADRVFDMGTSLALAKGFGEFWTKQTATNLDALKTVQANKIVEMQTAFLKTWPVHYPMRAQADGKFLSVRPLDGVERFAKGKRVLIGTNRDDSAYFIGPKPEKDPMASDLGNMPLQQFNRVFEKYAETYPEMSVEQRRIRAVTAEEYWVPTVRVADAAARGGAEVFMYRLDYSFTEGSRKGEAPHNQDLHLVWNRPESLDLDGQQDVNLAKQIHGAWLAFIKGAKPSAQGIPRWPRFDTQHRQTMVLDTSSRIESMPQQNELKLWDGLLEKPGRW